MVPRVSANFAAHACSALQLLFVPANALANGKEGSLGVVLFKDVQDLVGLFIPWAVVERERNNLVAVAVHVVVLNDVVDRFFGGNRGGDARFLACARYLFAVLGIVAVQVNCANALQFRFVRKGLGFAVGVGLGDVGAVGDLDLVAAVQVHVHIVGVVSVHLCGAAGAFTLTDGAAIDGYVVARRYRNHVVVQKAANAALGARNGYLVAV